MRSRNNSFNELVAETYRILQESKEARKGAEQELKKALKTASKGRFWNSENETQDDEPIPGFGRRKLR